MANLSSILLSKIHPSCAVWEITLRCNSKCIHCGSDAGSSRSDELSPAEALILVKQIRESGYKGVALMGGEPLLREDWLEIGKEIKNQKMQLSIITNGIVLKRYLKDIRNIKTDCVTLSLDGGTAKTHDYLRGSKGSFNNTINLLMLLKEHQIPVSIITTVNKLNLKELDMIKNIIIDRKIAWQIQIAIPIGRFPRELVLSREEFYALALFIEVNYRRYKYSRLPLIGAHCFGYFSRYIHHLALSPWIGCQAGFSTLGIQSNGNIKGCLTLPDDYIEGNIRDESLKDILIRLRKRKSVPRGYCQSCDVFKECKGGCLGTSLALESFENPYCLRAIENSFIAQNKNQKKTKTEAKSARLNNLLKIFN
jgi:radical SAM protein with 4Fe4S-binding SPASM domain